MQGPRKLRIWLWEARRRQQWLAAELGVSGPTVSRWLNGKRIPEAPYRKAIARLTRGKVTVGSWG
jgi:DNA-binding transcriptional regulator YdaS (Cro superfamily)